MSDPRKHHLVPEFLLKHFAFVRGKTHHVIAVDLRTGKLFEPSTRDIAQERDFYRVPGKDPFRIETGLGEKFEGKWAAAVDSTIKNGTIPDDLDMLTDLEQFIGFMSGRTRAIRGILDDMESWANSQLALQGFGDAHRVEISQNEKVRAGLKYGAAKPRRLALFDWRILNANYPAFVCSDEPYDEHCIEGDPDPIWGLLGKRTEITFPLSSKLMLIGRKPEDHVTYSPNDEELIARLNYYTTGDAMQMYSETDSCKVLVEGRGPMSVREIASGLQEIYARSGHDPGKA